MFKLRKLEKQEITILTELLQMPWKKRIIPEFLLTEYMGKLAIIYLFTLALDLVIWSRWTSVFGFFYLTLLFDWLFWVSQRISLEIQTEL